MLEQGSLVRLQDAFDVAVPWRGYELHPETPPGGMPLDHLVDPDELEETRAYLVTFADQHGVPGIVVSDHVPNTRRALAVSDFAREAGRLDAFRHRVMDAFWRQGLDIEDDAVLSRLAQAAGLDPAEALRAAADAARGEQVDATRREAQARGVRSIPCLFFGEAPVPLVGCQPYAQVEARTREAGARPRRPVPRS